MSYILDALRKAEQDRQRGETAVSEKVGPSVHHGRRDTRWRALFLTGLVLALIAIATQILPSIPASRVSHASAMWPPVLHGAATGPAAVVIPEPISEDSSYTDDETLVSDQINNEPALDDGVMASTFDDLLGLPPEDTEIASAEMRGEQGLGSRNVPRLSLSMSSTLSTLPSGPPAAGRPAETTADRNLDGRISIRDMPFEYRQAFPGLRIEVHVYDVSPERRWAMINGAKVVEGTVLLEGPRVVEIAQDGIVFDWKGRHARLPLNR